MNLLKKAGQDLVADSKHTWSNFFDKEGNVRSIPNATDSNYRDPSYIDFYHAIGRFLGQKEQSKYKKRVELTATVEALVQAGLGFAILLGLVSVILAVITQGQGWPKWIVPIVLFLGTGPFLGFMFFVWLVESWMTTHLANAFFKGWEQKKSAPVRQKSRSRVY